jgi:hypothetical protein
VRNVRYRPPSQIGIERPLCSACGTRMWLTLVEPGDDPKLIARTFECLDCNHSEVVLVEIKPAPSRPDPGVWRQSRPD